MSGNAKGKTIPLPRTINPSSGKDSTQQMGFSNTAWGNSTCLYTKSACRLPRAKFDAILEDAWVYMKPIRCNKITEDMETVDANADECGCLVASGSELDPGSELDEECALFFFIPLLNLTYYVIFQDLSHHCYIYLIPTLFSLVAECKGAFYVCAGLPSSVMWWFHECENAGNCPSGRRRMLLVIFFPLLISSGGPTWTAFP